jgi:DNA topoisomerase IB
VQIKITTLRGRLIEDTTPTGEDGRWVTIRGRPIFIGTADPGELDALKPDKGVDRQKSVKTFTKKDGTEGSSTTYGDDWKRRQSRYKFSRVAAIEEARGEIESSLEEEIAEGGTSMKVAAATALLLISRTGMRPGTPGGTAEFKSGPKKGKSTRTFGAHSIQRKHVKLDGDKITLTYIGKSAQRRKVQIEDPVLAGSIRNFMGGQDSSTSSQPLFTTDERASGRVSKHLKSGGRRVVSPTHINRRLKRHNPHFLAKDMRTAMGMRMASEEASKILDRKTALRIPKAKAKARKLAKSYIQRIANKVSGQLGNTPSVAMKKYTSPELFEHMLERLGFSPEMIEAEKSFREDRKAVMMSVKDRIEKDRGFPLLTALYGKEAVDSWQSAWLNDDEDEDEGDDLDILAEDDHVKDAWMDRMVELAGICS